jgi:hypothetical protein
MNTALPSLEGHLLLSVDFSVSRSRLKKYLRQLIVGCFTTSFRQIEQVWTWSYCHVCCLDDGSCGQSYKNRGYPGLPRPRVKLDTGCK